MDALVRGRRIFHERIGRGPPLVVVHGGPGLNHTYLRPWLEPLAASHELVFYDQLGNGRSERPEPLECGIEGWASEVDELCATLELGRVVLFGHSFGALLAVTCALVHPQRVAALVLCSSSALVDARPRWDPALAAPPRPRTDEEFRRRWNLVLPYYFRAFTPELGDRIDAQTRYSAAANAHGLAALGRFDPRARGGELRVPALVLGGRYDLITPVETGAARLSEAIPGSELVIFERSGHFPFIEETERFNEVLRDFLHRIACEGGIAPDDT